MIHDHANLSTNFLIACISHVDDWDTFEYCIVGKFVRRLVDDFPLFKHLAEKV